MSMIEYLNSEWNECRKKSSSTTSITQETVSSKSYDNLPRFTHLSIFQVNPSGYEANSDTGLDADASSTSNSEYSEPIQRENGTSTDPMDNELYILSFNSKLIPVPNHPNIFRIQKREDFQELFQFYYSNKLLPSEKCFPYFHGLNSIKQRMFFCDNYATENLKPDEPPYDIALPDMLKDHFHLMFINSKDDGRQLINLCHLNDLLTPKESDVNFHTSQEHAEFVEYKEFNHINEISPILDELNNRNFSNQMKLMASLSNFLVYNDSMDYSLNLNSALTINELTTNKFIYIVDMPLHEWNLIDASYFATRESDLFFEEQLLLSNLNSMKEPFPHVFTGTVQDFRKLCDDDHEFKLFVHCHRDANFPSLSDLQSLIKSVKPSAPLFLEFPSSGSLSSSKITYGHTLSFLNTLKLIHHYANIHNQNVFIFSADGFTEVSLLTLSLGCLWEIDGKSGFIEEVILYLLDSKKDLRLYLFKSDLVFLKKFERVINWVKILRLNDLDPIHDLDLDEIGLYYEASVEKLPPYHYDWFDFEEDNNFPSRILPNLYLGSIRHASSFTVLECLDISKIICVGEKPLWFSQLNVILEHELEVSNITSKETMNKSLIRPIYTFNNNQVNIYEITGINISKYPSLKLVIYIHNLKDDGRDSMMPLLVDCPDEIQSKVLINPLDLSQNTLVHCRIGVSRSATLAIALVMKFGHLSLLDAYMFVRVRRFNIIIQPNLRLFYELFCFEEYLNHGFRKTCWWRLCQDISELNSHYFN